MVRVETWNFIVPEMENPSVFFPERLNSITNPWLRDYSLIYWNVRAQLTATARGKCLRGDMRVKGLNEMTATERSAGTGDARLRVWCAVPCWTQTRTQTQAMPPSSTSKTITWWVSSLCWPQLTKDDLDRHFPSPSCALPPWGGLTWSTFYVKLYDAQKIWLRRSILQSLYEDPGNTRRLSRVRGWSTGAPISTVLEEDVSHSVNFLLVRQTGSFTLSIWAVVGGEEGRIEQKGAEGALRGAWVAPFGGLLLLLCPREAINWQDDNKEERKRSSLWVLTWIY